MKDNARGLVSVLDRKQLRGGRDSGLQNEGIKSIIGGKAMGEGCARMASSHCTSMEEQEIEGRGWDHSW